MQLQPLFLRGVIDGFIEKKAVIKTEDGQKILWPIINLPEHIKTGDQIRLVLTNTATEQAERQEIAKAMLNYILSDERAQEKV